MTTTLIAAGITALTSLIGGVIAYVSWRRAANNTPEMVANKQAATDLSLEKQAEAAITASDKGDLSAEQKGDAE